jgi:hypothetical protein
VLRAGGGFAITRDFAITQNSVALSLPDLIRITCPERPDLEPPGQALVERLPITSMSRMRASWARQR